MKTKSILGVYIAILFTGLNQTKIIGPQWDIKPKCKLWHSQSQFPALGSFHIGYFFFVNQLLDEAEYDLKNYADRKGC